jgi:FKBP-type peptidyl-prolyl cis-trans isomerase FkpA
MRSKFINFMVVIFAITLTGTFNVFAQTNAGEDDPAVQYGLQYWNKLKQDEIETESGLKYKILIAGKGRKPKAKNSVMVHYRGLLLDGAEFDSSYSSDEPIKFKLRKVIDGWTEGMQLMPEGSVFVFMIPPELGYGQKDLGTIPPNSTLIFEIELFGIK